ncbi:epidermal growth factor receptor-like [Littorina saxatilis]|uniref:receptor protein-tyrosine kinase n=1 Tax=Littorina saxatilis TaxID=31220 RepID=A0AAN9GLE2_9CAEN
MEVLLWILAALLPSVCLGVTFDEDFVDATTVQEERECHGTSVGFGYSGTLELHYQQLRKRYVGCTYVHGNLEITNLDDSVLTYELDFLDSIKYVSGYVLIGLSTQVERIPLMSLEVIRGNHTYRIQGEEYALVVALTSRDTTPVMGLRHLHMPKLKEISRGKVMFSQNPLLSHMGTVAWDIITRGRPDSMYLSDEKAFSFKDEVCPVVCKVDEDLSLCWGEEPNLCQDVVVGYCNETCGWRCYGPEADNCCHPDCAVGCTGPGPQECLVCKDYMLDEECVGYCPAKTYPKMQTCVRF